MYDLPSLSIPPHPPHDHFPRCSNLCILRFPAGQMSAGAERSRTRGTGGAVPCGSRGAPDPAARAPDPVPSQYLGARRHAPNPRPPMGVVMHRVFSLAPGISGFNMLYKAHGIVGILDLLEFALRQGLVGSRQVPDRCHSPRAGRWSATILVVTWTSGSWRSATRYGHITP